MRIKLWPDDATTTMEKFVWAASAILMPGLYLFMQLSAWGIFNNAYSRSVQAASAGWHVIGFLTSVAAVLMFVLAAKDREPVKSQVGWIIFTALMAVFSLLAYSGFTWLYNA